MGLDTYVCSALFLYIFKTFLRLFSNHKKQSLSYLKAMRDDIIEAVMEYYSTNRIKAMQIINLRCACGELDELIEDMKEECINV